ncbi:hypothetical protein GCE9029_02111 [Grimontia celer]|uniref:Mannosylglycerate hydrolase MGH1-like glycoside hydrolase domain-containing protein n=1 Tax=Grimontia celer TaxID=1796497 RepID=A0A128F1G9_9GAMM|nr:hypothetical protein [Grimontia celer]CZF80633.1 hypothetical protein GCE9029_02111 [Grimontia celer]
MEALDKQAIDILTDNDRGGYTIPTAGLYPYQWNWDSAFAALGFSTFDLPRAWQEIETLLTAQWDNGMVPHIVFHQPDEGYFPGPEVWGGKGPIASSGISQPPLVATFARKIFHRDEALGQEKLKAIYPALVKWHRWYMECRAESGVVASTHPWESGRDNAPDWDEASDAIDISNVGEYQRRDTSHVDASMRPTKLDYDRYLSLLYLGRDCGWDEKVIEQTSPFRVADPSLHFTLLRGHRDLAEIGKLLGEDVSEIDGWISTLEEGCKQIWNSEISAFDSVNLRNGKFAGSLSNASFLCWYAGIESPEMVGHLERILGNGHYIVPSYDPAGEKYDAMRYWRGPVWAIMNALIGWGLEEQGHVTLARAVRQQTAGLISNYGFAEYFNPDNGTPAGGGHFTWTAAVWLSWSLSDLAGG